MFGGLYSINGINDRPFLPDGTFIGETWKEMANYHNTSLRCSTFNCNVAIPKLAPLIGGTSEPVGVVCIGEFFLRT